MNDGRKPPNELLRQARLHVTSPSGSGRVMSRQELADAVNNYLVRCEGKRYQDEATLDANHIGKLERGEHRWPDAIRREAFRHVLGVGSDAELGFYIIRGLSSGSAVRADGCSTAVRSASVTASEPGPDLVAPLAVTSAEHLHEILIYLHEQWHALVKTDNLLGPRFALVGVLNQIALVEALRSSLRDEQRLDVVRLGARYAESAAWLYEDLGDLTQAHHWTSRAMEWAYEGDDGCMLAWTIFRRSQQAAAAADAAQAIGLAQAARRDEKGLATPTRAAIRVQEACGHALDGDEQTAQRLLDEAHTWAASDTLGDAHEGHGSYCTPSYIETQRATCWLMTGRPKKAIALYEESLRTLPAVYQRNRAATMSRLSMAYLAEGRVEQAASTAHAALPVARTGGSARILAEIKHMGTQLVRHRRLPAVGALLGELNTEDQ